MEGRQRNLRSMSEVEQQQYLVSDIMCSAHLCNCAIDLLNHQRTGAAFLIFEDIAY